MSLLVTTQYTSKLLSAWVMDRVIIISALAMVVWENLYRCEDVLKPLSEIHDLIHEIIGSRDFKLMMKSKMQTMTVADKITAIIAELSIVSTL